MLNQVHALCVCGHFQCCRTCTFCLIACLRLIACASGRLTNDLTPYQKFMNHYGRVHPWAKFNEARNVWGTVYKDNPNDLLTFLAKDVKALRQEARQQHSRRPAHCTNDSRFPQSGLAAFGFAALPAGWSTRLCDLNSTEEAVLVYLKRFNPDGSSLVVYPGTANLGTFSSTLANFNEQSPVVAYVNGFTNVKPPGWFITSLRPTTLPQCGAISIRIGRMV